MATAIINFESWQNTGIPNFEILEEMTEDITFKFRKAREINISRGIKDQNIDVQSSIFNQLISKRAMESLGIKNYASDVEVYMNLLSSDKVRISDIKQALRDLLSDARKNFESLNELRIEFDKFKVNFGELYLDLDNSTSKTSSIDESKIIFSVDITRDNTKTEDSLTPHQTANISPTQNLSPTTETEFSPTSNTIETITKYPPSPSSTSNPSNNSLTTFNSLNNSLMVLIAAGLLFTFHNRNSIISLCKNTWNAKLESISIEFGSLNTFWDHQTRNIDETLTTLNSINSEMEVKLPNKIGQDTKAIWNEIYNKSLNNQRNLNAIVTKNSMLGFNS
ncbi:6510_t:CDS:2 [Diversispora eburnea]|uniref:6510_t:CDS:1 n=1 Tax=Diversispora eburnea TaxID=1213867 RepID=A0A9N8ZXI7_9GLOM|nr:6510_t:CDS:2 [Diversispora eburnea]